MKKIDDEDDGEDFVVKKVKFFEEDENDFFFLVEVKIERINVFEYKFQNQLLS